MRLVRARTLQLCKALVALVLPVIILAHAEGRGTTGKEHYDGHSYLKREISRLRAKLDAAEEVIDSLKWQLQRCHRSVRGVNESRYPRNTGIRAGLMWADVRGDPPVGQTEELVKAIYPGRRLLTTSGRTPDRCSEQSSQVACGLHVRSHLRLSSLRSRGHMPACCACARACM